MKVLLTGSHGFVGTAFRKHLVSQGGADVTEVDIIHPVEPDDARDWFRRNQHAQFDLAIHCAAIVGGRQSIDGSPFSVASNVALDYDFVKWADTAGPVKTVLFSSSAVYPNALQTGEFPTKLQEGDVHLGEIAQPDNSYGYCKLTLEKMDEWAGLGALILRPFSGYSHDQSPDYPFRALLDRVRAGEHPMTVWSDTVRDFIHIDDIVEGVFALLDQGVVGPVNLATGRATSFTKLAKMMGAERVEVLPNMPTGVQYRVGDPTFLNHYYKPKITLEEGIARGLDQ